MLTADEAQRNVKSVERIPQHILPAGEARDTLLALARRGEDLYAYQAASLRGDGQWNLWIEALSQARRPVYNGRVAMAVWCAWWRELVEEAGLRVEVGA